MNKDLEQFENRSDDWLAKEKQYEARISAWDIDEGRKIKEIHRRDCEAREIKKKHEMMHANQSSVKQNKNPSLFFIFLCVMISIDVIPTIFMNEDFTPIPILLIAMMIFSYATIKTVQRRK